MKKRTLKPAPVEGDRTRLTLSLTREELSILRRVTPPRKTSRFIVNAALEKAHDLERKHLRKQIIDAYEADPEFVRNAGSEWESISTEDWPPI